VYAREDDLLGKALLGEGKALRQLFRRPLVHDALRDPASRGMFVTLSSSIADDCRFGGCSIVLCEKAGVNVFGGPQTTAPKMRPSWGDAQGRKGEVKENAESARR
jgi:hypothetical protein